MNIYFGKVTDTTDGEGYFEFDGCFYGYVLETKEDFVCIRDTANRIMPIDVSDVDSTIFALSEYMDIIGDAVTHIINNQDDVITIEI